MAGWLYCPAARRPIRRALPLPIKMAIQPSRLTRLKFVPHSIHCFQVVVVAESRQLFSKVFDVGLNEIKGEGIFHVIPPQVFGYALLGDDPVFVASQKNEDLEFLFGEIQRDAIGQNDAFIQFDD